MNNSRAGAHGRPNAWQLLGNLYLLELCTLPPKSHQSLTAMSAEVTAFQDAVSV